MNIGKMYRRCVKPCTGRLHDFYSRDPFDSCQSVIRGVSGTSVAEAFASQGRFYSRFAKDSPKEVTISTGVWRLNRGFRRLAQFQRREFTTGSAHSWGSCSEFDCTPSIPSAAFLLRHQRLLSGYAFRPGRQGLIPHREGLSRASTSFTRTFSDERGSDGKDQAAVSSSVGSGGDSDKEAEHVLACDSGGEEDESDEGQRRRHPAASSVGPDARSREGRSHRGSQEALFLAQKARYKKVFEERLIRWEDLKVTLEEFPHYLR